MDITVEELKKRLDEGDKSFVFIDVREPYEYQDFNLGAKLIPLGTFLTSIKTKDLSPSSSLFLSYSTVISIANFYF